VLSKPDPAEPKSFALPTSIQRWPHSLVHGIGYSVWAGLLGPHYVPEHRLERLLIAVFLEQKTDCTLTVRDGADEERVHRITGRMVCLMPVARLLTLDCRQSAAVVLIYAEPAWVRQVVAPSLSQMALGELDHYIDTMPNIGEVAHWFEGVCRKPETACEIEVVAYGAVLATQVLKAHFAPRQPVAAADRCLAPTKVGKVKLCIRESLGDEDLDLASLAGLTGLGPDYFSRQFYNATGIWPLEYLKKQRVLRARELMREGKHSVAWVSEEVGFRDPSKMALAFNSFLGTTPSSYLPG